MSDGDSTVRTVADDQDLGLADLLQALGEELRDANVRAKTGDVATIAWAEATVEVALEVKTAGNGGVKFAVLGIGAGVGVDRQKGRTIRAEVRCVPAGTRRFPDTNVGTTKEMPPQATGTVVGGTQDNKYRF